MNKPLESLIAFIAENNGINNKEALSELVKIQFGLTLDRSVFYCDDFAIRFSSAAGESFSNTVLSLSNLQKFDTKPFIVCLVTPKKNYCLLANSTFLKKISHSSHQLRIDNIKGSFNGSDILRNFLGTDNTPSNFEKLFNIHIGIGFEGNLARLVEATTNIVPTGQKFEVGDTVKKTILDAPNRAISFVNSDDYIELKRDLDEKVEKYKNEIILASLIENVNIRGRIIEYIIAGENEQLRTEIIKSLLTKSREIPQFKTENDLGDYQRIFDKFHTETDVKTKIMVLHSNPKAYNLDKILEFLSKDKSVFMFYFVGVDLKVIVNTVLTSIFQTALLDATILLYHWAGRNSRGVSQLEGTAINNLINSKNPEADSKSIQIDASTKFLNKLIAL